MRRRALLREEGGARRESARERGGADLKRRATVWREGRRWAIGSGRKRGRGL
jgi:hypothetical protein